MKNILIPKKEKLPTDYNYINKFVTEGPTGFCHIIHRIETKPIIENSIEYYLNQIKTE